MKRHLCSNCLTAVQGAYCAYCGQKHHSPIRQFSQVIGELFNDILNFDAKLLNTMKPLLFRPGFLSREYFAGRRVRYVSPLKLYFFLSIIAFFLIQQSVDIATGDGKTVPTEGAAKSPDTDQKFTIGHFNGKPWNAKSNPIEFAWLPDAGNGLINQKLGKLESTVKNRDWEQLTHAALAATPQTLLILLPIFALLLKLAYVFRGRLYMEHLIVALHNHAFLLSSLSLLAVLTEMATWTTALPGWEPALGLATTLLLSWIPLYFLLSLKYIYGQSWKMTAFKFLLIGLSYSLLLGMGVVINVLLGILML
ncbi:MAG TPA: DUF3667 domain-containing protein [Arenimonas sp.]|nr:DUF3667 domain-containing protein [Arenimonas sp.]